MSRLVLIFGFALFAFANGVCAQPALAHGDVIVTGKKSGFNPDGTSYVIATLVVFSRDGVLKGELAEVDTGGVGQPLYRDGIIYVPATLPYEIKRVDSTGRTLTPFAHARASYLSPGPAGGLLATNSSGEIFQFDATGALIRFRDVLAELPGFGGIELAADHCTVFYVVLARLARWDLCQESEPVFHTPSLSGGVGSIRLLPDGSFLIVSVTTDPILHVDHYGNVIRNYGFVGGGLALAVDGTSFWTSRAGHLTRVDIATGAILSSTLFPGIGGITVVGEPRAGLIPSAAAGDVPALSPLLLVVLAASVAALALVRVNASGS